MRQLIEKRNELEAKQAKLAEVFQEARKMGDGTLDFDHVTCLGENLTTMQKVEKVTAMNAELEALGKEVDKLALVAKAEEQQKAREDLLSKSRLPMPAPAGPKERVDHNGRGTGEPEDFASLFVQSASYKAYQVNKQRNIVSTLDYLPSEIGMKAVFLTTSGWAPESLRTGRVVDIQTRPIQVTDIFPPGQTGYAAVVYMEETTLTNAAVEITENTQFPESTAILTQRTVPVQKIATTIPVTDEQLEDVAMAESYLRSRITFLIRQRLDLQLLLGNGVPPQIVGVFGLAGFQTTAKLAAESVPDAIWRGLVLCRVTGRSNPSAIVMHPTNWSTVRLLRTVDGIYIWGAPSEVGPERMWGVQVVQSDAMTLNTAGLGDFATFSQLVERRGIDVQVGFDGNDFTFGRQTIRADIRVAACRYRAQAFVTVTALDN